MKALYTLFLITAFCKAQTPVLPLFLKASDIAGAYYKDIDNDFSNFTGTWRYISGTDTLMVTLVKKTQVYSNRNNIYEDYVVGEYKYVENGVVKINTLSNLAVLHTYPFDYHIAGNGIIKKTSAPLCNECATNERRLVLACSDPTRPGIMDGLSADVILRRVDVGTTQKIELWLKQKGAYFPPTGSNPTPEQYSFNLPWGKYILVKQP